MLVANVGIAAAWPLGTIALRGNDVIAIAADRYLIASGLALVLLIAARGSSRGRRRIWPGILVMGSAMAAYNVLYLIGLRSAQPGVGAVLVCGSLPVFASLGARLLLAEPIGRFRATGIGIAVGGVGWIALMSGNGLPLGAALTFVAAGAVWATHTLAARVVLRDASAAEATAWSIIFGFLVLGPVALLDFGPAHVIAVLGSAIGASTVLALTSTVLPLSMTMFALPWLGVTETSVSFVLIPILAILFSAAAVGGEPTLAPIVGAVITLAGVAITVLGSSSPISVR